MDHLLTARVPLVQKRHTSQTDQHRGRSTSAHIPPRNDHAGTRNTVLARRFFLPIHCSSSEAFMSGTLARNALKTSLLALGAALACGGANAQSVISRTIAPEP